MEASDWSETSWQGMQMALFGKSHDLTWGDRHTWVSENWMRVNVMSKRMNMDELLCSKLMDEVHEES